MFRLLAKAVGDKAGATDKESDLIAIIRLSFVLLNIVCALVIIVGNIHNW